MTEPKGRRVSKKAEEILLQIEGLVTLIGPGVRPRLTARDRRSIARALVRVLNRANSSKGDAPLGVEWEWVGLEVFGITQAVLNEVKWQLPGDEHQDPKYEAD